VHAWVASLRSPRRALTLAAVAGLYVGGGKLGLGLPVAHGVVTPVWAPSGIALAALVVLGPRAWPAVALAAFVVNATSGAGVGVAAAIAVGNTLEPVAGAYLLRRAQFRPALERVRDVLALVVLGALASTLLSATNGVTTLWVADRLHGSYGYDWLLWWFGDAAGILLVTPLLLVAHARRAKRPSTARLTEFAALLAALVGTSAVVFLAGGWRYPYLIFPFLFWATLRFRQPGAAVASFVVGALGTWGTVDGLAPIAAASPTERVQILQALVGLVAVTLLTVGATLSESDASRLELELAAARLAEAQELTHIGSWEWDVRADRVTWSDELYRVYGYEPQSVAVDYRFFLDCVHPADRALVDEGVRAAAATGAPFALDHRILRPDGAERVLHGRGRVILDSDGNLVRMAGTGQDVTERKQAEALRDDILATVSHELRTPLTSVLGFALTLKERFPQIGGDAHVFLSHIVDHAWRLERLLTDLLDVERLRRDHVVPAFQPTELAPLVGGVADSYRAEGRAVEVLADDVVANVDRRQIERIVDNLLGNAVRHTPDGTAIEVRVERRGGDVLIVVDDDGPGVPDAFRAEIFELFNRGEKMLSSERGTGIGLALVARFAALHGGRAWVETASGGGASFRVLLPGAATADVVEGARAAPA
jgi:PAS domain S-box-containing protein